LINEIGLLQVFLSKALLNDDCSEGGGWSDREAWGIAKAASPTRKMNENTNPSNVEIQE
jgi:hypothetical protein